MTKKQRKPTREVSLRHSIEKLHLGFAVGPLIASIIAAVLDRDIHSKIELVFIIIVIAANFGILWRRWPSFFYTFRTDDLPPNQSGAEQIYHVEVAIIETEQNSYYRDKVQSQFKTEIDFEQVRKALSKEPRLKNHPILSDQTLETLASKKVTDPNLFFRQIEVKPPKKVETEVSPPEDLEPEVTPPEVEPEGGPSEEVILKRLQNDMKKFLDDNLKRAEAVVMVRTNGLDEMHWVYGAVDDWAYEHSELPILIAQDPNETFSADETAKNFLWIRDDPRKLPWSLLQQAKDRGEAWRKQATYNRAMVWNIFYILLMCIWIGSIWLTATDKTVGRQKRENDQAVTNQRLQHESAVNQQRLEYQTAMRATDEALTVERLYRQRHTSLKDDPKLSTSYWFRHREKPHIFVTTEIPHNTKFFENGYDTIIGCGFLAYPNNVIKWRIGDKSPTVYNSYYDIVPDSKCEMKKLGTSDIKAIACATYNGTNEVAQADRTVGICVFTTNSENNIFGSGYRKFLRDEAGRFDKDYTKLIARHEVTPLEEREK